MKTSEDQNDDGKGDQNRLVLSRIPLNHYINDETIII